MSMEVTMPQMGESVVEGTVTKWLVKEGDRVQEDQPLCEISTDKVDTEIPSPGAGVIAKLIASEGETLPIGAPIALLEAAGVSAGASPAASAGPRPQPKAAPAPQPVQPPKQGAAPPPTLRAVRSEPRPQAAPAHPAPQGNGNGGSGAAAAASAAAAPSRPAAEAKPAGDIAGAHRRYSPVVMRMAEEHGIDLARIPGTGIGGRVSKRDVLSYLEALQSGQVQAPAVTGAPSSQEAAPDTASATPGVQIPPRSAATVGLPGPSGYRPPMYEPREGDVVEAFSRRRKLIAEHMVYSKTHSPHVGTLAEVDLTRVMRLRNKHKDAFAAQEGFALTLLPIAAAATVRALKEFPRMNASVVGESLIVRHQINLGIAMDTEEGLLVPVIKAAEGMSVVGIAREIERMRRKIADRKITADDLAGGSFTLTNPGREGNLFGFAIINQPQVGILRMGEIKKRPVVVEADGEDTIAIRTMMYLALSYDHRVIDGVLGNRFLFRTARILEEADFEL
jgi:pyruvate/2-oxoglutarate dehydrogenase complex dihydrolipoamide acyltransferase (E2) component